MPFVPAICPNCGGTIEVDSSHEAGICKYCGTPFVTEKAIITYNNSIKVENATINVQGISVDNLLIRARQFRKTGNKEKALEYYNRVLDIDALNEEAISSIKAIEDDEKYRFLNQSVSKKQYEEVISYIASSQKIAAIKLVREITGADLKTAKDFVDELAIKNGYGGNSTANTSSSQSGGCYIATSIYGSYDCPQVWTLRRYRDERLATTWQGRLFIHVYYAISPTIVKWFGKTKWFIRIWKDILDKKVTLLQSEGLASTPYIDKNW